ncbi:MAG TPA: hypothetical protein VFC78_11275 [Tepidisphaeraceae bacterium]|nr:hypothetical protein [Tepidisphaeraceae bacterium]
MRLKYLFVPAASLAIALAAYVRTSPARADEEVTYSCGAPTDCIPACVTSPLTWGSPPVPLWVEYVPQKTYIACVFSTYPGDVGKFCAPYSPPRPLQICGIENYHITSCTGTIVQILNYTQPGVLQVGSNCSED